MTYFKICGSRSKDNLWALICLLSALNVTSWNADKRQLKHKPTLALTHLPLQFNKKILMTYFEICRSCSQDNPVSFDLFAFGTQRNIMECS